ncbi:MAG: glycosyltransferase family A protein [Gaiellaceae bacterium]
MERPLVSIVIATCNGEAFLRPALESLFEQDYDPIEAILVDDGSEDGTSRIARSFEGLHYIRQGNLGLAAAHNTGINASNGEFIGFLDDDDVLPPNKVSMQVDFLEANRHVGCVMGRQEWINPPPWLTRDAVYGDLDGIPPGSALIRRSVLTELGGFDPTFRWGEDMDLLVRMREQNVEMAVLPEIVLYRRFTGTNMTAPPNRPAKNPLLRSLKAKLERERTGDANS